MTSMTFMKTSSGAMIPADQQTLERVAKLKCGEGLTGDFKRQTEHNVAFHRKLFALANLAYEAWEPVEKTHNGIVIAKNFDQFRDDLTILAGHYTTSIRVNGDLRFNPKSWSFATMTDDEKDHLYNAIINVVLSRILTKYTRDDLDNIINQVLAFT